MTSTLPTRPALALVALVSALAAPLSAQDADRTLTPADVAVMRSVSTAAISPDGGHVAYVRSIPRTPREDEDGSARSELWVLDPETGEDRPYVTADSGVSRVSWTPDGEGIAFLAKRDGDDHTALYVLPVRGGEARRVAALEDADISSYAFSHRGDRVALLARAPKDEAREQDAKDGFAPEVYEESWRPIQAWTLDLGAEDAEPVRLDVEGHVSAAAWSPDDRRLALAVAPTALVDDSYVRKRIRVVDSTTGEITTRVENPGKLGAFEWEPDGAGLAMIAAADVHDGSDARLMYAELAGGGATVVPTEMLGARERDEEQVHWLPDGSLVVRGSHGTESTLDRYTFDAGRATDRTPLVPEGTAAWRSVSVSDDGSRAALVGSTADHPTELFTLDLASGTLERRTDSNPWLAEVRLARQEVVRYPARDGLEIEGVLIHPLEADGPAPLIVVVHGGPEAHQSNGWLTGYSAPGQVAAGRGYAIFYPNYRGSTGRGIEFLKLSQGDPAGKEFDDVVDGVDHLIELGVADGSRVGVTGGSYGGYATAWLSTFYTDRFAAGVMFVGISNNLSKIGTTDIPDEMYYVHSLRRPWEDWQFFLERSPIYHADGAHTPLLILHGKEDTRVDPGQSREMYRHLKLRGEAPVRLVNYPGEGHGNRKAGARFDYGLRSMRWFDHYLLGPGGDPPPWPVDYDAHLPADEEPETSPGT